MPRELFYGEDPHPRRAEFHRICEIADRIIEVEDELINSLIKIDRSRSYVRFGYKALGSFCKQTLGLSKTQSQRIVTEVRRRQWGLACPLVAAYARYDRQKAAQERRLNRSEQWIRL